VASTILASDTFLFPTNRNGRFLDYCQNGVYWTCLLDTSGTQIDPLHFYYSTDLGANWI